ncbi:hypothetical protein RIF25_00905 [Thermosynechococcaceae cyanobacterium BACA0444]|uniref:Uncharacterized protein n=1 Tax=Pseudocalidococcus azoricus BACA0444 TaxID=2918990 RepID=A0AAE4FQY9_9CYAN|nr:hypothetical protein [Pseudocalidococcus azoricus]MDS3859356.1 hypothetical protein [Pseudocalidococcus azoricus BACA0444]
MLRFITHHWQTVGFWLIFYSVLAVSLSFFTHTQLDIMQNRGHDSQPFRAIPRLGF